MTNEERDKVIEKIQKLLNLAAEGSGATEAEAATALQKANEALVKHGLSMAEVEAISLEKEPVVEGDLLKTGRAIDREWQNQLAFAMANANFCKGLVSPYMVHFIGRDVNVEAVKEMYLWVKVQLEQLLAVEMLTLGNVIDGELLHGPYLAGAKVRFKNAFLRAAVQRLSGRMWEAKKEQQEANSAVTALVVSYDEENDAFVHDRYPRTYAHAGSYAAGSSAGYTAGQQAGDRVSLQKQVTS